MGTVHYVDSAGVISTSPFFRTPYNYDRDAASDESGLKCEDKSLAQQQFKEETDINEIVRRFGLTGQMPEDLRVPTYGDFTDVMDFQTAMNAVTQAQEQFMALPAELRAHFANDPQNLMTFLDDDRNRAEAEKLGLLKPHVVQPAPAITPQPKEPQA